MEKFFRRLLRRDLLDSIQRCVVLSRAIVRPPSENFAQGLTTADLGAPDYERALRHHEAYCAALELCGLTLTRLESDPLYPDSTFVEDTAVLTNQCAILTQPGAPSRVGETARIREALADFYPSVFSIQPPGTLDGGDVCEAENHFFIGISERTNESGARQLAKLLGSFDCTSSFVDIRGLKRKDSVPGAIVTGSHSSGIIHLKSGISYLGDNRLVVTETLANRKEFRAYDLVRVNAGEEYAANCVRINHHVLVAAGYLAFEGTLRGLGYHTVALDMMEFRKMDGGLSCLSLRF